MQGGVRGAAADARLRRNAGADRPPDRWRLPVRPGDASPRLSRRQPASVRHGLSGGGLAEHVGASDSGALVRAGRYSLGRSLPLARSLAQPFVHDLAAAGQANALDQLVVVGKHRLLGLLVPEGAEEIVDVAGEQRRSVGGQAAGEIAGADDHDAMTAYCFAGDTALDIAPGL